MRLKINSLIQTLVFFLSPLAILAGIYFFTTRVNQPKLTSDIKAFHIQIFESLKNLKPHGIRSSSGQYLFQQLACPLLKLGSDQVATNFVAHSCEYQNPTRVLCKLNSNKKWSDGQAILAHDYESAFKSYISSDSGFFRQDLLLPIKNAKKILGNELASETLGVTSLDDFTLAFDLEEPYNEFLFHLANPILTLYQENHSCGPFEIETLEPSQVTLKPNPFYQPSSIDPQIRLIFKVYSDDNLALKAFDEEQLDFVKRIPSVLIPKLESHPAFVTLNVLRMDAIFVNLKNPSLIKLAPYLAHTIDFQEWQNIYHAKSPPGCFGVPIHKTIETICIKNQNLSKNLNFHPEPTVLYYSKLGGVDHDRAMQFVADQWKKNLRIEVSLEALENSYFQSQVQKSALGLYRRGFSLERPTCLAALEVFHSEHKQNHIGFQSPEFDHHIRQMKLLKIEDVEYHDHCRLAVEELLLKGYMIPTGPIYFSMLIRPNWKGWKLNSLNHLDLESLRFEN